MLPPDFNWVRKQVGIEWGDTRWLYVRGRVVGVVGRTIHGQWYTTVNRHLEPSRWRHADCCRLEQGMHWVERWATAHAERLRTIREK